jgi:hypothetical protein
MKELQVLLVKHDIVFDHLNNCIMCFPHIINICTAHIIAASTEVNQKYLDSDGLDGDNDNDNYKPSSPSYQTGPQLNEAFITTQLPEHQAWLRSLSCDPVKLVADIVCHIRASDARKQCFADIIHLCTKDDPELHSGPPLQLI